MTPTAVVIVNFNTRRHLRACLASVFAERPSRVVVVDNASRDGSVEMLRAEYPGVELVANRKNLGFGAAANQGIASCGEPYVLLLNADTTLQAGALRSLAAYLDEHPVAAVVGPRLSNADGTLQRSARTYPQLVTLRPLLRHVPLVRELYLPTWSHSRPRRVPYVVGAALAIRRRAFDRVGGFDPDFFLFYEEVDLCRRLRLAGWEVHFAPVTTVAHAGGASTSQVPDLAVRYRTASERRFYGRLHGGVHLALIAAVLNVRLAGAVARDVMSRALARDPIQRGEIEKRLAAHLRVLASDDAPPAAERRPLAGAGAGV